VPAFESEDKKVRLHEANAIAYYVANDQLRGNSVEERAQVLQWLNYGSTEIASAVASWVFPALSLVESTDKNVQRARDDLAREFKWLDEQLKQRTYLVGERLSLADIGVAADLWLAYEHVADEQFRKPYTNLNRWFLTVVNQTHFKAVAGEIKLAVKAPQFDG
jgi:elongation factor 1-gamma